jgi:D-galactose 1-dehydrogenase
MSPIKLAIVGLGKIARDQHLPAIARNPSFELVAIASPHSRLDGVANFPDIATLLGARPSVQAVSICTPPHGRYDIARYALVHGRHVMLEKPPGATLGEVASLAATAEQRRVTLFATWHSRAASAVEPARDWLAARVLRNGHIHWKEDVRVWHPGQTWIWKAGGFGVFDPGINALSVITHILPDRVMLRQAELFYPANCETPIAANLELVTTLGASIRAEFDFRETGPQRWDIDVQTDAGRLLLTRGGSHMHIRGNSIVLDSDHEYAHLYAQFASLVSSGRSDVDLTPLQLVADAFMYGRRTTIAPFIE